MSALLVAAFVAGGAIPCPQSQGSDRPAEPQGPIKKGRIHSEVNLFRFMEFETRSDHREDVQSLPLIYSADFSAKPGAIHTRVSHFAVCQWKQEETIPGPLVFPQPERMTVPALAIGLRACPLALTASRTASLVGNARNDPSGSGSPGGGTPPPPPPAPPDPAPPPPAPSTKSSWLGGESEGDEDSDAPFLTGPEIDLTLTRDVTQWRALDWLPERTSIHVYARLLFGRMELFDEEADVELYGVGARVELPIVEWGRLRLAGLVSAGPAILDTDMGEAVGFNGAVGLKLEQGLVGDLSLSVAAEYEVFIADETTASGPALLLGLNVRW